MKKATAIPREATTPLLKRVATWEEWEQGRAARRVIAERITGGKTLRRKAGDPRKDALLRRLYAGERGMPFPPQVGAAGVAGEGAPVEGTI
jgi:cytochrome P450